MMRGPFGEIASQAAHVFIVTGVARERWGERLGRGVVRMQRTVGPDGTSLHQLFGEIAQLLKLGSLEPPHLLFERTDTGDLADSGWNPERQQVTSNIERASGEAAPVRFRLHVVRTRQSLVEKRQDT